MSLALISIIIPVFNSEDYLAETIESAKNQTWENKEIIIVDDGSTDNSLTLAQGYACDWIRVYHQENKGASAARNYGLRVAKGSYIQFLDADDLLEAKKLELQVNELLKNPLFIAIGTCIHFIENLEKSEKFPNNLDQMNDREKPINLIKKLYGGVDNVPASMIEIHSWLSPRVIIDKAGLWNEAISVNDDGEFFLRVVLASSGIIKVENAICYYRKFINRLTLSASALNKIGLKSSINALNLKAKSLYGLIDKNSYNKIFGKFYWEIAYSSYPGYLKEYKYCLHKSNEFNYSGKRFIGPKHLSGYANFFGWKLIRIFQTIKHFKPFK
jgi:glycosyltransferase involved in cell wall biosynthesis